MKRLISFSLSILFCVGLFAEKTTVRIDVQQRHQHITGFGGYVCSPQFQYSQMSESEIKKVGGPTSTLGCNIMRLYLPVGESSWGQSLVTAKLAKKLGLIVFASPWGQPKEWKTSIKPLQASPVTIFAVSVSMMFAVESLSEAERII